ncbi:MAG: CaiB/BaiF CoA-transferase family protein [Proteobacteria bacterium]|nr:CaiB/BaiF CoA-transferase family protein [Pseudomonadota bacterium]
MTAPASTAPDEPMLSGITVVDFTRVLAGPYCTRMLADLGARVIKIERPGEGDEIRHTVLQLDPERTDQSTYFARLNAGKESIAIDLAHPQARELVLDLVRKADVVVENFSPGVMKRYGLDEAALRALRPDIVYCSISGFGQTGPLSSMQAYAHLINAISGMMDLDRCGDPEPRVSYLQAADVLAGANAFGGVCAALVRRGRSGRGAYLDVSMLECLVTADDITYGALLNGAAVQRQPRVGMVVHPIAGRYVALQTAGAPHLWLRLVALIGRPELASDPRFATPTDRRANWSDLLAIYRQWLDGFDSVEHAVKTLSGARIPAVPMLSPEELVEHPQMAARAAFPHIDHPAHGPVRVTALPFHVDQRPVHPARPAPWRVGQNTRAVLTGFLGYSEEQVSALESQQVVEIPR